eukprot:2344633-Pleurochrysis_carterae.AAC.1
MTVQCIRCDEHQLRDLTVAQVMFESLKIAAKQDGAHEVLLTQHGVMRCKDSGHYFAVVAIYKLIAGFKVAHGAAGDTLAKEDCRVTLEKCSSSAYFGFGARTGVICPPRF